MGLWLNLERAELRQANRVRSALAAQVPVFLGWESLDPAWFRAITNNPEYGDYLAARHAADVQAARPMLPTEAA